MVIALADEKRLVRTADVILLFIMMSVCNSECG